MTRAEERKKLLEEVETKRREIYERHKLGTIGNYEWNQILDGLVSKLSNFVKEEKL